MLLDAVDHRDDVEKNDSSEENKSVNCNADCTEAPRTGLEKVAGIQKLYCEYDAIATLKNGLHYEIAVQDEMEESDSRLIVAVEVILYNLVGTDGKY